MPTEDAERRSFHLALFAAGAMALPAWWALAPAAPGGGAWRWLEYPASASCIAFALFLLIATRRTAAAAVLLPIGTAVVFGLWEMLTVWREHSRLGATGGPRMAVASKAMTEMLAPWLIGGAYTALAVFAMRARNNRWSRRRVGLFAAGWLGASAIVVAVLCLKNRSWLTFENIGREGTFRSSTAWPDTKLLCISVAVATLVAAVAWAAVCVVRKDPDRGEVPSV